MNFLAHIFLSPENPEILLGNFAGDFIKGSTMNHLSASMQKGVRLHRAIDTYTDSHVIVLHSKKLLRAQFRHYAPVIVDVFYDHFLAKNWNKFSNKPLLEFTQDFYKLTEEHQAILPEQVNHMLAFMKKDNWLFHYQSIEGINKALTGMSKRTKFDSKMEVATKALEKDYHAFEVDFLKFFPQLVSFTQNFES